MSDAASSSCLVHPDVAACARCSACGADLCPSCEVRAHGDSWCEACFAARVATPAAPPPLPVVLPPGAQLKSPPLAAFLGLIVPGLGTIYAMPSAPQRGLVQFGAWAFLLWLMKHGSGLLAFVAFVCWFGFYVWQAVDAHACARAVNAFGRIPTEAEAQAMGRGPLLLKDANDRSLGIALLVVGGILLVGEIGGAVLSGLRWLIPIALLVVGAVVVVRARRKPVRSAA